MYTAVRVAVFFGALVASATTSWMLGPFDRPPHSAPVLVPDQQATFQDPIQHAPVHWEALHTFNPAAVVRDRKVCVLFRAEDNSGANEIGMHTSRIGLAESDDGIHFTRRATPVLYPGPDAQQSREWPGGVEDPRIVESEDGTYVLTYTQWNRKTFRAAVATSPDLLHWEKHGPIFGDSGKYANLEYKSAAIVTRVKEKRLVAAKINGTYWMYWGERPIRIATSPDLIHWRPVENGDGKPVVLLAKRPGLFDSAFPEAGPPPVLTPNGIVVVYNGKNSDGTDADPSIGRGAYSVGQALFSTTDPTHLLERMDKPFFRPELPFEKTGQYAAGTTFAEGLALFRNRWFLYYGCADSFVGVAISDELGSVRP